MATLSLSKRHTQIFRHRWRSLQVRNGSESKLRVTDSIREIDGTGIVIDVTQPDLPQFVTTVNVLICCIIGQLPSACDAGWTQKARLYVKVGRAPKYGTFTLRTHCLKLVC